MDHRLQKIAIGPVAIFGASNFPSVIQWPAATPLQHGSGATVSAQGPQRPPGRLEIQARAIRQAVQDSGLPEGVFSMVRGSSSALAKPWSTIR
jgi:NADP-dependent aldehyde dehydrogenase